MPGNSTNFDGLDVVRCFLLLDECRSRSCIKNSLELGEGSIRGILGLLKDKGYVDPTRQGHVISKKGQDLLRKTDSVLSPIAYGESEEFLRKFFPIYCNNYIYYCKLYQNKRNLMPIYIYRDFAIKAGANGALVLFNKKQKLVMCDYNGDLEPIEKMIGAHYRDSMVLITLAQKRTDAYRGMLNMVTNLTDVFDELIELKS